MKSYEIWLKGGGSITGTMDHSDAAELRQALKQGRGVFFFKDGDDDDEVSIVIEQIAALACREEQNTANPIGFNERTTHITNESDIS